MAFIKFIGTAGARFVVMKQLRSSGGVWLSSGETNLYVDPGPGALVRCLNSKPKLDPSTLSGILLTHKHLDHSGDVNVMIEAMTEGGFKKRGTLFAPGDALGEDPVVLKYVREYVKEIAILKENGSYRIGDISFSTALKHRHRVETYGLNVRMSSHSVSFITDTRFFPEIPDLYTGELLVIHVVRFKPIGDDPIDHLSIEDVKTILRKAKPKLAVLTHFGMTMIQAKPWVVAAEVEKELGIKVIAASDGLKLNLEEVL
ncbi:MAG TPA: MBL fold metallo-hydrolase [Thermodesulfobacteriota bacterium]|nr:MBL fold metallo-hydrolase [Thermodesulfobacteriota bacterium]